MEEESSNFDHFLIKETNKENVFFDILSSNEENSQWALNWIDKVNRLSQIF